MIPKNKSEAHTLNLIRVRLELRLAAGAKRCEYTAREMYHMCRAKAIADVLGISDEEFREHKRLVEIEEGLNDLLLCENAITLCGSVDRVTIDLRR